MPSNSVFKIWSIHHVEINEISETCPRSSMQLASVNMHKCIIFHGYFLLWVLKLCIQISKATA